MRGTARVCIATLLWAACLGVAPSAVAQGHGGGGAGRGGGMGPGGMGDPMGSRPLEGRTPGEMGSAGVPPRAARGTESNSVRPGLELGPPGRWWDDRSFAKSLKLRPDQQKRMDSIFEQNRPALLTRYQNLLQAEAQMQEVAKSASPDESALFADIDSVAQARAEVEKAYTHMLLQIRREMDPDQIARLARQR